MSRRTSVMENLMKVQPSFSAPRSKSFAEWYEKVDEVLDSLQLNDYSFGQTIHKLKGLGVPTELANQWVQDEKVYRQDCAKLYSRWKQDIGISDIVDEC